MFQIGSQVRVLGGSGCRIPFPGPSFERGPRGPRQALYVDLVSMHADFVVKEGRRGIVESVQGDMVFVGFEGHNGRLVPTDRLELVE